MIDKLFPDLYVNSVFGVPYDELRKNNICGLIFDIDNTLVSYDIQKPTPELVQLFGMLQKKGFTICLLSNNNIARVELFNQSLRLPAVGKAKKPTRSGVRKALRLLATQGKNTALIGDQVFTDVLCGKRCGLYTILVKPVTARDEWTVRLKRLPEKLVLWMYARTKGRGNPIFYK